MRIFSGTGNMPLTHDVCKLLDEPLLDTRVERFSDGEPDIELMKTARGYHALIMQSLSHPFAGNLMDTAMMVQAAHLNGAKNITAILYYYGSSRQDRRFEDKRTAITAKLVADILYMAGARQMITVDIHNPATLGFFPGPFRNVPTTKLFAHDIRKNYDLGNAIILSPDAGGVERVKALAEELGLDWVVCYKKRDKANSIKEMRLIGDIADKDVIVVDDIADTCGTLVKCEEILDKGKAKSAVFYGTHGVLSGNAIHNIAQTSFSEIVMTDTILHPEADEKIPNLRRLSIAPFLAEGIRRSTAER